MKKVIYLLSMLLLFQSCYSYKTFDFKDYKKVKPKKVKIELKDSRKLKGKILDYNNNSIVLKTRKEILKISNSSIFKIKGRNFSYLRTGGAILGATIVIQIITILIIFTVGFR